MITKADITQSKDFRLVCTRPEAEPEAVQVDAWIGDLYLGQFTYYSSTITNARKMAKRRIEKIGHLNLD